MCPFIIFVRLILSIIKVEKFSVFLSYFLLIVRKANHIGLADGMLGRNWQWTLLQKYRIYHEGRTNEKRDHWKTSY